MQISSIALIILVMMLKSSCMHAVKPRWTSELDKEILKIYYQTLPSDKKQLTRIKTLWVEKVPAAKNIPSKDLWMRARELIKNDHASWSERSNEERNLLDKRLNEISENMRTHVNEEIIFQELLRQHPEYRNEKSLIRNVVHQWYRSYAPNPEELYSHQVNWQSHLKADLCCIAYNVKGGSGNLQNKIKRDWSLMHPELNVRPHSLKQKVDYLRGEGYHPTPEEWAEANVRYANRFLHSTGGSGTAQIPAGHEIQQQQQQQQQHIFDTGYHTAYHYDPYSQYQTMGDYSAEHQTAYPQNPHSQYQMMGHHSAEHHSANAYNPHDGHSHASSSGKQPVGFDLNQHYQEFDLNEPYHHSEFGGSSGQSHSP